jgi:hypothetical protein
MSDRDEVKPQCPAPNEGPGQGVTAYGPSTPTSVLGTISHLAKWSIEIRCDGLRGTLRALFALLATAAALGRTEPPNEGGHMPTHIDVCSVRTVEHLDSNSAVHAIDRERAIEARARKTAMRQYRNDDRPNEQLKFPSLGGGLLLAPDGGEVSGNEHKSQLVAAIAKRSFYWRDEVRSDGRLRRRKRKTKGIHNLAITARPDFAAMLSALERSPRHRHLVRPFVVQLARDLATEFAALTGLEVLFIEGHTEEGNLHLHISYASVSASNELLWAYRSTGRKGLRCLGPWHIGNLRLSLAGYVPKDDAALAVADLRRVQSRHGELPVDWLLSVAADGRCEAFVEKHGLHAEFAAAAERYGREVRERRAQRPDQLKAKASMAESERARLANENAALREQVRQLLAAVPTPSKAPVPTQIPARTRGLVR